MEDWVRLALEQSEKVKQLEERVELCENLIRVFSRAAIHVVGTDFVDDVQDSIFGLRAKHHEVKGG